MYVRFSISCWCMATCTCAYRCELFSEQILNPTFLFYYFQQTINYEQINQKKNGCKCVGKQRLIPGDTID